MQFFCLVKLTFLAYRNILISIKEISLFNTATKIYSIKKPTQILNWLIIN